MSTLLLSIVASIVTKTMAQVASNVPCVSKKNMTGILLLRLLCRMVILIHDHHYTQHQCMIVARIQIELVALLAKKPRFC